MTMTTAQEARSYAHQDNWDSIKLAYKTLMNAIESASKKGEYNFYILMGSTKADTAIFKRLEDDGFKITYVSFEFYLRNKFPENKICCCYHPKTHTCSTSNKEFCDKCSLEVLKEGEENPFVISW